MDFTIVNRNIFTFVTHEEQLHMWVDLEAGSKRLFVQHICDQTKMTSRFVLDQSENERLAAIFPQAEIKIIDIGCTEIHFSASELVTLMLMMAT